MHRLHVGVLGMALLSVTVTAQSARFAVAIVRNDGHLIPFAAYDNGRWVKAWNEAGIFAEFPRYTLKDVPSIWQRRGEPIPLRWRVFPEKPEPPIDVRATGVEYVPADSEFQWALTTNLPARGETTEAESTLGVATDGAAPITRIEKIKEGEVAWTMALDVVIKNHDRLESAQAAKDQKQLTVERLPLRLMELYREVGLSSSFLYFVSEKDHANSGPTIITGWLKPFKTTFVLVSPTVSLDDDPRRSEHLHPLGAIHMGQKTFWIGELNGYEHSADVVAELSRNRVRLVVQSYAGGA